ncbi:MAG: hypothetical protein RI883_96 [Bacteroidota bacterium]|jgi:hypothetical protein
MITIYLESLYQMRKITAKRFLSFSPVAILLFALMFSSCGGSSETDDTVNDPFILDEDYYEFKGINLKEYNIPANIMLPDETANIGASTKPEIIHAEGDFIWDIVVGPNFSLHIEDFGDITNNVEYKKAELKKQEIFKINYLVNEKDLIVYKRSLIVKGLKNASYKVGVKHDSYHVYGQKIINGIAYALSSRDEGYEKMIIELMAKSIQSFKPSK